MFRNNKPIYIYSHIHSKISPDARNSVTEMCEIAAELGITHLTITDHVDCDLLRWVAHKPGDPSPLYHDIYEDSVNAAIKAKNEYKGRLNVFVGAELGEPCHKLQVSQ